MDLYVVTRRFAQALSPDGSLAIIDRNWDTDASVWQRILPIIASHTPVRNYHTYNIIDHLVRHGLLEVDGQQRFGPEPWRPTIDEYRACRHSQRGLSRTHMGPSAVAAFDAEVRRALGELIEAGALVQHGGRLELAVVARVTWGRPGARRSGAD